MKIRETLRGTSGNLGAKALDNKKQEGIAEQVKFIEHLSKLEGASLDSKLNELLEEIDKQGERLSKNIDIKELMKYKKLISSFLNQCVSGSIKFSKDNLLDRRGRHRVFAIIRQVNDKLELLTKDLLSEEKENIDILKSIDDIRGLLLDLYM